MRQKQSTAKAVGIRSIFPRFFVPVADPVQESPQNTKEILLNAEKVEDSRNCRRPM